MCLTEIYPESKIIKKGVGYKVFLVTTCGLTPCFYYRYDIKTFQKKKVVKRKRV